MKMLMMKMKWKRVVLWIIIISMKNGLTESDLIDDQFEQVISQRYLLNKYSNESTGWKILPNIDEISQIESLPEYHSQSSDAFWLLAQSNVKNSSKLSMYFMSQVKTKNPVFEEVKNISFDFDEEIFLVSSNNRNTKEKYNGALISLREIDFFLCNPLNGSQCSIVQRIPFPQIIEEKTKKIFSAVFIPDKGGSDGWIYLGCDSGLHALDLNQMKFLSFVNGINVSVSSISFTSKYQTIFIGTETKLWIENYQNLNESKWRFEHITGLIDGPIKSLTYFHHEDQLWIGQDFALTILSPKKFPNGNVYWYFTRLAGEKSSPGSFIGHLPLVNLTHIRVSQSIPFDNSIWLASIYGLIRFNPQANHSEDQWRLFNSGRYFPNRQSQLNISSLIVLPRSFSNESSGSTTIALTNRGLAILTFEMWTLDDKAKYFQNYIDETNRHLRYDLVSDCQMSEWGNVETCLKQANDNDGLWTSMYLASQIFRFLSTKDPSIPIQSWKHFQALKFLNQVTGISGYPARSIAHRNESPSGEDWFPSPFNSSFQYKSDTSSDEIVGHLFVYPLVYDYLAQNDQQRLEALELIFDITNHILTHNYYLINEYGNHTTWGIWNPKEINFDPFYQESRGLNSLQIFSFFLQIYTLTGDERFYQSIEELIQFNEYDQNLINEKIIALCDESFSDDELTYLAYFTLINAFQRINSSSILSNEQKEKLTRLRNDLKAFIQTGLDLSHQYKQVEKSPFYNWIYCFISKQENFSSPFNCEQLFNDSIWYLQRWPLELVNWPQFNSIRLDLNINDLTRWCGPTFPRYSQQLFPPDERSTHKWNGGQFDLDDGDAFTEEDPTSFLLSYWPIKYFHSLKLF